MPRRPEIDESLLENKGRTIRASSLLGARVFAAGGKQIGSCHDIWTTRSGPELGQFGPALRLRFLLVGRGAFGERLGYLHGDVSGPWALRVFFEFLHRSSFVVGWDEIARIRDDAMYLRPRMKPGSLDDFEREHHDEGMFLALRVLDGQIVDRQGRMSGEADDLELTLGRGGSAPYVSAILSGPGALAHRLGGRLGLWMESVYRRVHLASEPAPVSIPFDVVTELGNHTQLSVPRSELGVTGFEDWVRDRIISRIPGSTHPA